MQTICIGDVALNVIVKIPATGTSADRLSLALMAIGAEPEVVEMHGDGLGHLLREYRMIAHGPCHQGEIAKAIKSVPGVEIVKIDGNPCDGDEPETLALASFQVDRTLWVS